VLTHAAERAVLGNVVCATVADVIDQTVEVFVADPQAISVVDLEARGLRARRNALDILDREHAIGSGAPGLDAKGLLCVGEEFLASQQLARQVGADIDQVLAHRMELEHLVERPGSLDLGGGGVGQFGDLPHGVIGDPPLLFLCKVQERDERRLRNRVPGDGLVRDRKVLWGEVTHRSTSPMIGSTLEMMATPSAIRPPCIRCGMVWRLM